LLGLHEFINTSLSQWAAITAVESSDILHLTLKDGKRLSGKVTTEDGRFVVAGAPESIPPAAKDTIVAVRNDAEQRAFDIAAEKMAHPKFTYFWSGLLDTGLALTRGNSSTASYTLSPKGVRETPRDKLTLYTTYVYASDSTTNPSRTTANALRSGIRGDLNISPASSSLRSPTSFPSAASLRNASPSIPTLLTQANTASSLIPIFLPS
jgi:hypothetical protein